MNADAPYWLVGMTEMTRTFGLELLESVLNDFPGIFLQVAHGRPHFEPCDATSALIH